MNNNSSIQNKVQINYLSRDFQTIKTDLENYIKFFFPDQWKDFQIASPGMALLELNAYVGDLLSYTIDKKYNELFLDGIKERSAVYRRAKTFGFKIPGVRPAITVADISIDVPTTATGPDEAYLPIFRSGVKIKGAGQTFETTEEIDFSNDFSEEGIENRKIEPILNANQDLIKYRIIKREKIKAGITRIFKKEVSANESKPFYELTLPETNVLEILSVIVYQGQVGITDVPTYEDFNDTDIRFWEVDYLPNNKIFIEDESENIVNGVKYGRYLEITKRFIKEFLSNGACKLTFGGGDPDYNSYDSYVTNLTSTSSCADSTQLNVTNLLQNTALGEKIMPNSTIFVKYRIGGGPLSNVGSNTLQEISNINPTILGPNAELNASVISSARANNPIPAMGGLGLPSVNEVKNYIPANFASQERCVELKDYIARAYQIPGEFGAPFRIHGKIDENKVKLYILSRDGTGKLASISSNLVKNNLVRYLTAYRMTNDFVEINDGKFVNLQVELDLFVDKSFNVSEVKLNALNKAVDFFDIEKWQMNQHIYVHQLANIIGDVPGVINVVQIKFYNMENGGYNDVLCAQATGEKVQIPATGGYRTEINLVDNTLFSGPIFIYEVRFPNKDIRVRISF